MKTKTLRRLSILLCLALVLAMLPVAASASGDTITVYFQNNWKWSEVSVHYWNADKSIGTEWPGVAMTYVETNADGNDIYSAEIPTGLAGVIFNGIKDDGSGNRDQSPDIADIQTGVCYYMKWDNGNQVGTYEYAPSGGEVEPSEPSQPAATYDYYVAGNMNGWNAKADGYGMTKNGSVYEYTMTLEAQSEAYALKVTDGTWKNSWGKGGSNYEFMVNTTGEVLVTFNPDTKEVTVTGDALGEVKVEYTTIYFDNTSTGWPGVNYHCWGGSEGTNWPGKPATQVKGNIWAAQIPSNSTGFMFVNPDNNDQKSADLAFQAGGEDLYDGTGWSTYVEEDPTPVATDIKWQMTKGTTAASGSTDVRFVTYVDSLDYKNVTFTFSIEGQEAYTENCTAVYEKLNADGAVIESASSVFGEDAAYFVAFTMKGMPAAHFDKEITVTVTWYGLDGEVVKTAERTIVVADAL